METQQIAEEFVKGYDCSQVVFRYFAEKFGIPKEGANRIAAGFGGGMLLGSVCGVYTGGLLALGLKYGHSKDDGLLAQKDVMIAKNMQWKQKFEETFGDIVCKNLLGYDVSTPEGLQGALDSGRMMDYCPRLAKKAIQILEEIMEE